jgi:hypothetical protein
MFLTDYFVDTDALPTNFNDMATVALMGRLKLDASVTVLVDVPINERCTGAADEQPSCASSAAGRNGEQTPSDPPSVDRQCSCPTSSLSH